MSLHIFVCALYANYYLFLIPPDLAVLITAQPLFIMIVTSDLPATKLQWRVLNDEACVKLQVEFCLRATIISRRWISVMPKRAPSAMIINPSTRREVEEEEEKKKIADINPDGLTAMKLAAL